MACSACSGDYEDPDRTAWTAISEDGEPDGAEGDGIDEAAEAAAGGSPRQSDASDDDSPGR